MDFKPSVFSRLGGGKSKAAGGGSFAHERWLARRIPLSKTQPVSVSFRRSKEPMSVADWDRLYKQTRGKAGNGEAAASLFQK